MKKKTPQPSATSNPTLPNLRSVSKYVEFYQSQTGKKITAPGVLKWAEQGLLDSTREYGPVMIVGDALPEKRRAGRPSGSKNKIKPPVSSLDHVNFTRFEKGLAKNGRALKGVKHAR